MQASCDLEIVLDTCVCIMYNYHESIYNGIVVRGFVNYTFSLLAKKENLERELTELQSK